MLMRPSKHEFTQLLSAASAGDEAAKKQLWTLMYDELRRVAHEQLLKERRNHTLTTTELVDEAYLRLVDQKQVQIRDRVHFRALAARAMREILIDYARRRKAQKRGGGRPPVSFDEALHLTNERAEDLLALDEALSKLERLNERLSKVIECLYFGGYTRKQTAEVLEVSERTIDRDWVKARGWLYHGLYGSPNQSGPL